jgi:uncharacterized protein
MSDAPMSSCTNCGGGIPAGAGACPTCGTPAPAAQWQQPPGPAAVGPSSQDSRSWAMGVHLSALAGAFIGGIGSWVGPLVIWLLRREQDPFVAEHALEGLNFNITMAILVVGATILGFLTLGLGLILIVPAALIIAVLWFIWTIQAAMAASRGESYRYPLSIRLVRG